jgi:hypothetical protein
MICLRKLDELIGGKLALRTQKAPDGMSDGGPQNIGQGADGRNIMTIILKLQFRKRHLQNQ